MAKKQTEDVQALKDTIQQQYDYIQELQTQLKGNDTVSRAEFGGLLKQFEYEKQSKEQYKELLEKEKAKKKTPDKADVNKLTLQIQEMQKKLSRQCSGRPRSSDTPDADIIKLRADGKTVTAISDITGISTATINRILRNSNSKQK